MKIKMLPNWGKKLGFSVFITCFFISGYSDFMDGLTGQSYNTGKYENLVGRQLSHVLEILSILGLIIYMFSKEKIEDDYINKLRPNVIYRFSHNYNCLRDIRRDKTNIRLFHYLISVDLFGYFRNKKTNLLKKQ
jgi:hypothetical protein